ncbi:MAG: hypothetical protein IPJ68_00410 [Candidatus Moraniibacteriota bacterium]|nr:MAG: hypothetical protein IPJ68_00410 [Candidatus Moranbacteria bacterium]
MFKEWFKKSDTSVIAPQTELPPELSRAQGAVEEGIYRGDLSAPTGKGFDATPLTQQAERESQTGGSIYALPNASHDDWQGGRVEQVSAAPGTAEEDATAEQEKLLHSIKQMQTDHPESFEKPAARPGESDERQAA